MPSRDQHLQNALSFTQFARNCTFGANHMACLAIRRVNTGHFRPHFTVADAANISDSAIVDVNSNIYCRPSKLKALLEHSLLAE